MECFEFAGIRLSARGITTGNEGLMYKQKFATHHCENLARKLGKGIMHAWVFEFPIFRRETHPDIITSLRRTGSRFLDLHFKKAF